MSAGQVDPRLLCPPGDKIRLENRNASVQLDFIEGVLSYGAKELRVSHVRELKRIAIDGIFGCRDEYRTYLQLVTISNSDHGLPEAALVPGLVQEAVDWINAERPRRSALERAAYALWRFNWIHPFAGGNGRTSRALAYLIVCMEHGDMLPGVPTMPAQIYEHRDEYILALRHADAAARDGRLDISMMTDFLQRMLTKQLAAAIDALSSPSSR